MRAAFVFPGQGSQKPGMGKDLYDNFDISKSTYNKASEVLGFDIASVCFEGPLDKLKLTEIAQPAILTTSIAALRALNKKPDIAAGHSLGEYSALVCASAISFEDAVKIVHLRGKFMQDAVPLGKGAMAAVLGLARDKLNSCLESAGSFGIVEAANYNSPGQIVISGEKTAVEEAAKLCKEAGAKRIIMLEVSAPFHCSLMAEAARNLKLELDKIEIRDAQIPVVSNVLAKPVNKSEDIRELLVKQVTSPVLWEDSLQIMSQLGINQFIEIGFGKVLSGLIKKTIENATIYSIEDSKSVKEFIL